MKTIKMDVKQYTSYEDLVRINNELDEKAKKGLLVPLRQEPNLLMFSEPRINGIWNIYLDSKGCIEKIVLF